MDAPTMKPTFIIEYCHKCYTHQWNSRHNEAKYLQIAQQTETAIKAALPNADINCKAGYYSLDLLEEMKVQGTNQVYKPTEHMFTIAQRNIHQFSVNERNQQGRPPQEGKKEMEFLMMDKMAYGGLEVYFQGVRLFSKIQSGMWPHIGLLSQKAAKVYNAYMAGEDISIYETQQTVKKQIDMLGGEPNVSYKDNMSNYDYMSMGGFSTNPRTRTSQGGRRPKKSSFPQQYQSEVLQQLAKLPPEQQDQIIRQFEKDYPVVGREITLAECQFVFERIWKTTIDCCHEHGGEAEESGEHKEDHLHQKEDGIIMIDDLFHLIDLAGTLLNKKAPSDDSTRPYEEFMKYADTMEVTDKDGQNPTPIQYVRTELFPTILLGIFIGQPDEKRIDAASLIQKYIEKSENKLIIEHIVDQIWAQYDTDNSGVLERDEAQSFVGMVLDIHEKTLAAEVGRKPKEITEEDINAVINEGDTNNDGNLSKEEVNTWVKKFMQKSTQHKADYAKAIQKKLNQEMN